MISKDNIRLQATISRDDNEYLKKRAAEKGITVSQLVSALIAFDMGKKLGELTYDKLTQKSSGASVYINLIIEPLYHVFKNLLLVQNYLKSRVFAASGTRLDISFLYLGIKTFLKGFCTWKLKN